MRLRLACVLLAALGSQHAGALYVLPGSGEFRRAEGYPLLGAGATHFDPARRAMQTTDGTSNASNAAVAAILTQPARCIRVTVGPAAARYNYISSPQLYYHDRSG